MGDEVSIQISIVIEIHSTWQ